jgi:hypothetical protein
MTFLQHIYEFFGSLFGGIVNFFAALFERFFHAVKQLLMFLFKPLFELLDAIFYFIYKVGLLLVLLVKVILAIGKLLISAIKGLFTTIAGFGYTGGTQHLPDNVQETVSHVLPALQILQLNKIAFIFLFAIWMATVIGIIAIIGRFRSA